MRECRLAASESGFTESRLAHLRLSKIVKYFPDDISESVAMGFECEVSSPEIHLM